jgi:hypothetical protein
LTRTLTIGARTGSFQGMPASRTFSVILVTPQHAFGYGATPRGSLTYTGALMRQHLTVSPVRTPR